MTDQQGRPDPSRLLRLLGRRAQDARVQRHLTQGQLAEMAGVSRNTVSALETARSAVGVDVLLRVAMVLEVDPCSLLPVLADATSLVQDEVLGADASGISEESKAVIKGHLKLDD